MQKASNLSTGSFHFVEGSGQKSNFLVDFQEVLSRIEKIENIDIPEN